MSTKPGDLIQKVKKLLRSAWSAFRFRKLNFKKSTAKQELHLNISTEEFPFESLDPVNQKAYLNYLEHIKQSGYVKSTLDHYSSDFATYMKTLKSISAASITPGQLRSYFLYCLDTLKLSEHTVHNRLQAIKYYYEQVLHRKKHFADIPRPQRPERALKTLNDKEIKRLIAHTKNIKHRLILQLIYEIGLQLDELINLKISDVDKQQLKIFIRANKMKKDRHEPLPVMFLPDLNFYQDKYKPKKYLFEGKDGGQYALRSVQAVFRSAMNQAKINKRVGVYGIRPGYAKQLTEAGVDIKFIQRLSDHSKSNH